MSRLIISEASSILRYRTGSPMIRAAFRTSRRVSWSRCIHRTMIPSWTSVRPVISAKGWKETQETPLNISKTSRQKTNMNRVICVKSTCYSTGIGRHMFCQNSQDVGLHFVTNKSNSKWESNYPMNCLTDRFYRLSCSCVNARSNNNYSPSPVPIQTRPPSGRTWTHPRSPPLGSYHTVFGVRLSAERSTIWTLFPFQIKIKDWAYLLDEFYTNTHIISIWQIQCIKTLICKEKEGDWWDVIIIIHVFTCPFVLLFSPLK